MGPSLVGEGSDCSHWTWASFWIWLFSPACTGTFLPSLLKALFAVPVPHVSLFLAKDLTLQSKKQGNGRCPWASRGPPRTLLLKGGDPEGWWPSLGHHLGPWPGDIAGTLTLCPAGHASQQRLSPGVRMHGVGEAGVGGGTLPVIRTTEPLTNVCLSALLVPALLVWPF